MVASSNHSYHCTFGEAYEMDYENYISSSNAIIEWADNAEYTY